MLHGFVVFLVVVNLKAIFADVVVLAELDGLTAGVVESYVQNVYVTVAGIQAGHRILLTR